MRGPADPVCGLGFFLIYALAVGLTNPAFLGRVKFLVRNLFYTKEGIFSTPVNVCSKYIVVFIIFGAFLERTGISNFFIQLANCIAGKYEWNECYFYGDECRYKI